MDTEMTEASKPIEPHNLSLADAGAIPTLDGWIESLVSCKQLQENEVRRLCDKVTRPPCSTGPLG